MVLVVLAVSMLTSVSGLFEYSEVRTVTVYAPAVSSGGQGVLSKVTLAVAYPGNGRVFFSALPYTEVETQGAARLAAYIASLVTKQDFTKYDYYVLVESDVPLIGGPSAGGLMTVGFASLLLGTALNNTVTMTGMINPDGSIGPVGGLKEKLEATASKGFRVFLIPAGQRTYNYPVYEEYRRGPFIIRRARYVSVDLVEYGKSLNVSVIEVSNIGEALYYFTGFNLTTPLTIPPELVGDVERTLGNYSEELIGKVSRLVEDTAKLVQSLRSSFYKYYYSQVVSNLNSTLTRLSSIREKAPAYSTYALLDLYKNTVEYYWSIQVSSGIVSVNDILSSVNTSITEALNKLYSETCTLENGFMQALLYSAWLQYMNAVETSDTSTKLEYSANALKLVELTSLLKQVSLAARGVEAACEQGEFTELYSHALGVYTYVSRLIEEAGGNLGLLDASTQYVNVLNYGYENKSPLVYGAVALVTGYSSYAIHSVFSSIGVVLSSRSNLLGLYAGELNSPLIAFYHELAEEALLLNDTDTASTALMLVIALLQVQRSVSQYTGMKPPSTWMSSLPVTNTSSTSSTLPLEGNPSTSTQIITSTPETSTPTPLNETTIPNNTTSTTPVRGLHLRDLEVLVALILVLITALLFIRLMKHRRAIP